MKFKIREEGNIRLSGSVRLVVQSCSCTGEILLVNVCLQLAQVSTSTTTVLIVVSSSNYY